MVEAKGDAGGLEEIQRRRRRSLVVGIATMVLVCGGAVTLLARHGRAVGEWLAEVVEGSWQAADVRSTIAKGEQIRSALEAHYADHGVYPDALTALMPTYLQTLPTPDTGYKIWMYQVSQSRAGYELGFAANESRYPSATVRQRETTWRLNQ